MKNQNENAPLGKVFITGVTGYIGGSVAKRLINSGYQVAGLTRPEEKTDLLKEMGLEPVIGTLDDVDILTRACPSQKARGPLS